MLPSPKAPQAFPRASVLALQSPGGSSFDRALQKALEFSSRFSLRLECSSLLLRSVSSYPTFIGNREQHE
jgi:hypothetical protein